MPAAVEWTSGVVRVGRAFRAHGDPYEAAATVLRRGGQAELLGGSGRLTPALFHALLEALAAEGITYVAWERAGGRRVAARRDGRRWRLERGGASQSG